MDTKVGVFIVILVGCLIMTQSVILFKLMIFGNVGWIERYELNIPMRDECKLTVVEKGG